MLNVDHDTTTVCIEGPAPKANGNISCWPLRGGEEKSRHGQPKSVILQSALNPWTDGISKNRNAQLEMLYIEFTRSHMIVTIFSRLLVTRLLRTLFPTIGSRHVTRQRGASPKALSRIIR